MSDAGLYWHYPKRICEICGNTHSRLLFEQHFCDTLDGTLMSGYDVVLCEECGFAFADHIPEQAAFDAYYRDMSKYEHGDRGGRESEQDLFRFEAVVDTVSPFLSDSQARVLDVGCASGGLLGLFKERGFVNVMGMDPSPQCALYADRLYGVPVVVGTLSDVSRVLGPKSPFACVIMSGVLEHLRDLGPVLTGIGSVLTERGVFFAEVPDACHFDVVPDAPYQQFSSEHINFFSSISLGNLMGRHGFHQVLCTEELREQTCSTKMPLVSALYRKEASVTPASTVKDSCTETALREYIRHSRQVHKSIERVIDAIVDSEASILVWGVGTHTLRLLATTRLPQARVKAFVDSNPRYVGKHLNGIPIISPKDVKELSEPILVSSRVFQREIEHQVREELKLTNELMMLYQV